MRVAHVRAHGRRVIYRCSATHARGRRALRSVLTTRAPSSFGSSQADGWMAKVKLSDPSELDGLMDAAAYEAFCNE